MKVTAVQASAKPSPTNLTLDKRRALVALENDESIVILLADKGRSTVVLDYKNKVFDLLSDATTYTTLKKDPTSDDKKKVIDCLQKLEKEGVVDQRQHHRLYPGAYPKYTRKEPHSDLLSAALTL